MDALRDYLAARNECLSGHELASSSPDAMRRGVQLVEQVLLAHGVQTQALASALEVPVEPTMTALLTLALDDQAFEGLVQRLDQVFDLDIEPRAHMAP